MTTPDVKTAYETLRGRVMDVAALNGRCTLTEGAGRFLYLLGAPLLAVVLAEAVVRLPLAARAPVLPLLALAVVWCGWRWIIRPMMQRHTVSSAAMLVEAARPEMKSCVISALQLYPELEKESTWFDRTMLGGLVLHAQQTTAGQDFRAVIDRRPARRAALAAAITLAVWAGAFAANPSGMAAALSRLASAWDELREVALQVTGAKIVIEKLDRPAYLRDTDIRLRIAQQGFRNATMQIFVRPEGEAEWQPHALAVGDAGRSEYLAKSVQKTFECYCTSGRLRSEQVRVIVTDRPRIVKLSIEYDLPAYVRRAPIVQPRSDGNLSALYGSSVLLTIEANKNLKSVSLMTSFRAKPEPMSVGGQFAQGAIQTESEQWLKDARPEIKETYTLQLTDEYGYQNEDANRPHPLVITKDQPPAIEFVGLPQKSSAVEPHITDKNLEQIGLNVRGRDDYGIAKVVLNYRIEDLETGREKSKGSKPFAFGLPMTQVALSMARATQLGLQVGDRLVFWAEAEDAYDLDPKSGPHKTTTPPYRIAIVTEEQLFSEVRYSDEWSAQWYDGLKVASLAQRMPPPRLAPEGEPAANVAKKLLGAVPMSEGFQGEDAQAIQNYFESIAGEDRLPSGKR